jgi:hypothetical protein
MTLKPIQRELSKALKMAKGNSESEIRAGLIVMKVISLQNEKYIVVVTYQYTIGR